MRWIGLGYRELSPKYSHDPLSGEGARISGGRFNPVGTPALYLSTSLAGMMGELTQSFLYLKPRTICTYEVDLDDVIDLSTDAARETEGIEFRDMDCAWKALMLAGNRPPSWDIAERMINKGASAIVVPSFAVGAAPGATNIIAYRWSGALPHKISIHDPDYDLPRNPLSWT